MFADFVGDPDIRVSDKVRGFCPVESGAVGSRRARVVEFSYYPTNNCIRDDQHEKVVLSDITVCYR